ncbi:hypothetical protein AUJ17_04525 [Candidatus Micrarchaeota archaeon CG1_02_47_40]|nr:MAG: hypothetical protein AUJ17_04525 [Candidatus Micrarchaeota archaeon CG1_02_47_40]
MSDQAEDFLVAKNEEQLEQKDYKEAEATAQELVQRDPKEALAWFVKGKTLYLEGEYEESLSCLAKSAELERENAEIWHVMGFCLIALQRYGEAIEALEYVKSAKPKDASAIYALGLCYVLSGDIANARKNTSEAISLNKELALKLANSAYTQAIETSQEVSSSLKAQIERNLETIRVAEINGYGGSRKEG